MAPKEGQSACLAELLRYSAQLMCGCMRVQVPTTVMAAVDASVGIKTAVNFENRKNKMGTYCPPLAVYIDRCALEGCHRQAALCGCFVSCRFSLGLWHADSASVSVWHADVALVNVWHDKCSSVGVFQGQGGQFACR